MKMVWKYGEEAICPKCGHNNACLYSSKDTYVCRDCGRVFVVFGELEDMGVDPLLGRKIVQRECREI